MTPDQKDFATVILSALAFTVSMVTFIRNIHAEQRARNSSIIQALQGHKGSIIYVAHMAVSSHWAVRLSDDKFRRELLTALCVAWPMERSSRARSAVFNALKTLSRHEYKVAVTEALQTLQDSFTDYRDQFADKDVDPRIADVARLADKLGVNLRQALAPTDTWPKTADQSNP